jgi:hypothetical protein
MREARERESEQREQLFVYFLWSVHRTTDILSYELLYSPSL